MVWGGVHVTLLPEESIKSWAIDYILKGHADTSIVDFANALASSSDPSTTQGIVYMREGRLIHNHELPSVTLSDLPDTDWSLVDITKYTNDNNAYMKQKTIFLSTSRGCQYSCTFCYGIPFRGPRWQARTAKQVIEELDQLGAMTDYDIVFFHDDNFSIDKERLYSIVSELALRKKKYVISANASTVDEKMIELLARTGCIRLDISVETGSPRLLKLYKKGFTHEQIEKVFALGHKYKIPVLTTIIIGHPEETMEDLDQTMNYMDYLKKKYPLMQFLDIKILTPYPGTEIFKTAISRGLTPPNRLEDWGGYYWNTVSGPTFLDKRKCIDLSFISLFAFRIEHLKSSWRFINATYHLLHLLAKWRWDHRFFYLPIETRLMHWGLLWYSRMANIF